MKKVTGGCLCGTVRYASEAEPAMVVVCHCITCQKTSGSAFSLNLLMPTGSVTITGESLATYEDHSGASGKPFYRTFCSRCGSPIRSSGEAYPGVDIIKVGTLDDASWVKPTAHIWCAEKQPWVVIEEGVAQMPENPG